MAANFLLPSAIFSELPFLRGVDVLNRIQQHGIQQDYVPMTDDEVLNGIVDARAFVSGIFSLLAGIRLDSANPIALRLVWKAWQG